MRTMLRVFLTGLMLTAAVSAAHAGKVTIKMATLAPDGSAWDNMLKQMGGE